MTTTKPIMDYIRIPTKKTGSFCPTHTDIELITDIYDRAKPFCPKCAAEDIEKEKVSFDRKATRETVTKYLYHYSLLDDPLEWENSFDDFEAEKGTKEYEVKQKARLLAGAYLKNTDKTGEKRKKFNTIFFGDSGAGKTHLAMAMLKGVNDYAKPPKKCLFINVNTLMDRIFSSFNNPTEMWTKEYSIKLIGQADLVVLDDLGTESSMTDKGQASEFVQKLLYRISNRQTELIITTNLSQQQFKRTYNSKIISRLFANTKNSIIDFSGITDKRY